MTRCADCGRALTAKPALVIGAHAFGPVCSRRYIVRQERHRLVVVGRLPRVRAVAVDAAQLALEFA